MKTGLKPEHQDPIHSWFELSYSSYLVIQRSILQSMPVEWQNKFVECLEELENETINLKDLPNSFWVRATKNNKFIPPLCTHKIKKSLIKQRKKSW